MPKVPSGARKGGAAEKPEEEKVYVEDLKVKVRGNDWFRNIIFTAGKQQLVAMSLLPEQKIDMESHPEDQFFYIVYGKGKATLNGVEYPIKSGTGILVPGGAKHEINNTSKKRELKLFTIYSPPKHKESSRFKKEEVEY